jgi:type IV pilus biogenesis protein CpaD/CtpE
MKTANIKVLVALALALAAQGCASRAHMSPNHGRAVASAKAAQLANPEAGRKPHRLPGFDAQEASLVAKTYRESLQPDKGTCNNDRGMVMLAAPSGQPQQPYIPPPSVPERK